MALVDRNLHERERRRDPAGAAAEEREEEVEALPSSFRLFFRRGGGHRLRCRGGGVRCVRFFAYVTTVCSQWRRGGSV